MKRLISKVCLSLLWIVAIFLGALTALFGIPQASSWVSTNISSLGDMFKLYENLFADVSWLPKSLSANLWGVIFACALILVLLLISIIPAVIIWHKKPMKGEDNGELNKTKEESESSFVDAKGNFGHVVIKGDIPSPLTKYSEKLSDKQLDMEFDWHNYVRHTPVVRIVIGVILAVVSVLFLVARFASYLPNGALKSINDISFVSSMNSSLNSLMNSMFGTLAGKTAFGGLSAMQLLDFVFWILLLWVGVFVLLLISTFVAWIFRKGGAIKRAEKARKNYLEALSNGNFDGKFLPSASIALGVTVPENRDSNGPKDIPGLGTGIVEINPVEGKYEGNVVDDSVTSVSLSTFNNDVLILGKPLFQSLADIKEDESKPSYEGIEYYADGQGHILPLAVEKSVEEEKTVEEKKASISIEVKEPSAGETYVTVVYEPRPSDRLPEYWFKKALEKSNLPSDQEPEHWYENNKVEEPVEEEPAQEQPVEEQKEEVVEKRPVIAPVETEFKIEEDDLDRRIINALEPIHLHPINEEIKEENKENISSEEPVVSTSEAEPVEEKEELVEREIRPSDREPEYWYEKNATVVEEEVTKEIRPSDREPWYWYGEEPSKEEEDLSALAQENPEPIEKGVVAPAVENEEKQFEDDFDRRVLNALNPFNLTPLEKEQPEVVEEKPVEEQPIVWPEDRPSDKEPEYWYDKNKVEEVSVEERPSDKEPEYWYDKNQVEEAEKINEDDFDRRVLNALNPDNLAPVEEEKAEVIPEAEEAKVEEEPYVWPTDRPSDKEPEYWYDKNKVEESPVEERPSDKEPEYWYDRNKVEETPITEAEPVQEVTPEKPAVTENDFDRRVLNALNPNNLTPLEEEKPEAVEEQPVEEQPIAWPTDRPSDKEPEYWYDKNQVEETPATEAEPVQEEPVKEELVEEKPVDEQPIIWPEDRPSDKEPEYWYDKNQVEEAPATEAAPVQEEPVEEPFVFTGERASDFLPEHWYHLAKIESERRPSDEEPSYWYDKNEIKKKPNVKPVGIAFTPKERTNGPKPTLIQPIRPVKEEPAPASEPVEEKPVGPVTLASHKIHEAPKIKINPVEARLVKFQLKKVQGNYKGELTPEEAFANALTNQVIVVNPVLQGQGSESGSKYLANMANKEKNQMRRTGYVSAVSVNLADNKKEENKPVFNKPVSEFKSIREWSQAKKKFEEEQKALAKEAPVKNETALPKKPIDVIKPIKKPVEPVSEEKKPEQPKVVAPIAPIRPVVPPKGGFNRPKAPIKPIKPIDINKKGE